MKEREFLSEIKEDITLAINTFTPCNGQLTLLTYILDNVYHKVNNRIRETINKEEVTKDANS